MADHADLGAYSTEGYALAAQRAFETTSPDLVLMGASAMGKDLAPRRAARLELAYLPDVVELTGSGASLAAVRPMYAGKVRAAVKPADGARAIVTLRPNVFPAAKGQDHGCFMSAVT